MEGDHPGAAPPHDTAGGAARRAPRGRARGAGRAVVVGAVGVALVVSGGLAWVSVGAPAGATTGAAAHDDPAINLPYDVTDPLAAIDAARAAEGLAPMDDSGFGQLTRAQELFVVIDLERVAAPFRPSRR